MNITLVSWLGRLVLAATMFVAGGHFIYYLYHWEWVRAQIAGVAFIAALVIAATLVVLARLDRMERRICQRLDAIQAVDAGTVRNSTPVEITADDNGMPDFPWLAPEFSPPRHRALLPMALLAPLALSFENPQQGVFIPVLLGAGLALSVVAGLVERTSASAHRAPAGRSLSLLLKGVLVGLALVGLGIGGIWWSAHYRPAPFGDGVTEMTVQVSSQGVVRPAAETVEVMGRYCARTAIKRVEVQEVRPSSADSAVLVVSPMLDEQGQRRFAGCLQDANLDQHSLNVTDTVLVPREER
jgi:hypothetical protein